MPTQIAAAAKAYRAAICVGMEYRYMPAIQRLRQQIAAGAIGTLRMVAIREHRHPFLTKVGDWNRFSRRTGGTLVEKCCHFFDLMRLIVGDEPSHVTASGAMDVNHLDERYGGEQPDIIDNAFVIVDFRRGARAILDLCMFAEGARWEQEYVVTGDRARVDCLIPSRRAYATGAQAELQISDRAGVPERIAVSVDTDILRAGAHSGATYYQHLAFRLCILESAQPEVAVEDGLKAVAIGLAAELSAKERRVVPIDGISFH
jgi:predicted dehydrogenase